ncbi:hypothetical protein N175_19515 (plasmid) [Vibrio anguillarum M3]|nr:hypothetical protein N175_19515 [Vibrio anguillarum M3]
MLKRMFSLYKQLATIAKTIAMAVAIIVIPTIFFQTG